MQKDSLTIKAFGPAAEAVGHTLQNVWELVFGGFDTYVQKVGAKRAQALADFKASLEQHIADIPQEALHQPRLSILGPTLEASKFYYEEKPLREMFAALAAASMDSRKEHDLHPSYPEIIKQMSPLDAENLRYFSSASCPLCEYQSKKDGERGRLTLLSNVFIENKNITDLRLQSMSISSLSRIGLISVTYDAWISAYDYDNFKNTPLFAQMSIKEQQRGMNCEINKGYGKATPLGEAFMAICLS